MHVIFTLFRFASKKISPLPFFILLASLLTLSATTLNAQSTGDYKSVAAGNWATPGIWERFDGAGWGPTSSAPTAADGIITLQSPFLVTVTADLDIDQAVIEAGATVIVFSGTLSVLDGAGTDFTVNGTFNCNTAAPNLTINAGAIVAGNVNFSGTTITNNGTITGQLDLFAIGAGSHPQVIGGTGTIGTLLTANDLSTISLAGDQTITSLLNFNYGSITTGPYNLIIGPSATIQNNSATEWYVNGNLQKNFPTGSTSFLYRIGDASGFRPVIVSVNGASASGGIALSTIAGDHPSIGSSAIDAGKSLNRYWRFMVNGQTFSSASATINYDYTELDAGVNPPVFKAALFDGDFWTNASISSQSDTSMTISGLNSYREIQIGESNCAPPVITCAPDLTICADGPTGAGNLKFFPQSVASNVTLNYADRMISYSGVSINSGGDSVHVTPGSNVTLSYTMAVAYDQNTGYCPGCVVQSSIGLGSTFQTLKCEPLISDGYNSNVSINFTAPSTPGIYYLTQEGSLDFFCQEFKFNNNVASAIGVLIVGTPYPTATGGCVGVSFTNNAPPVFPVGITQLTWTAKDSSGNISTCTQKITVLPATVYYRDRDADGFGNPDYPVYACSQPTGFILENTDCNDYDFSIHTGCGVVCNLTLNTSAGDTLIVCIESGQATGSVTLVPTGGTAPFTYGGDAITGLVPGIYNYSVTDANGCTASATLQVIRTNCIIPYYEPPVNDTTNRLIGAELTQLYSFPASLVDTTASNNVFLINDATGQVLIEVIAKANSYNTLLALLQTPAYGINNLINNGDSTVIITGFFPIANLPKLNQLPQYIVYVRPYFTPIAAGLTGLTTTQGDSAMLSNKPGRPGSYPVKALRLG